MRALFYGSTEVAVDAKGRLSLPAEFRDVFQQSELPELQNRFYMIKCDSSEPVSSSGLPGYAVCVGGGLLSCLGQELEACDLARAQKIEAILPKVEMVRFDNVGRLTLPTSVVQSLALKEKAVFIGVGRFFELWSPADVTEHQSSEVSLFRAELRQTFQNNRPGILSHDVLGARGGLHD